jgi:Zn/Cd-binding protein ZinT
MQFKICMMTFYDINSYFHIINIEFLVKNDNKKKVKIIQFAIVLKHQICNLKSYHFHYLSSNINENF